MTSIKVKYRPSTVAGKDGAIYYQIIHNRTARQISTEYHIRPEEWNAKRAIIVATSGSDRDLWILSIRERVRSDVSRLIRIVRNLQDKGLAYTADDIVDEFRKYSLKFTFFNYMESSIIKLKRNGKTRTSETYTAALNSFRKFRKDEDLMLDCINSNVMEDYEAWQRSRGLCQNSISFYTRIFRAVYNRAVEDEIIVNRHPFRHVYTGVDKTVKRALSVQFLRRIKGLDLTLQPQLDFARDMFLMSFYLRGMSFIDMAFLKKTDLQNGHITYRRRKTGQQLTIAWTKEMQQITDKYPNSSCYLLPIVKKSGINERNAYLNSGYKINRSLKQIAGLIGAPIPLSLYVARHSWASVAKAQGIPVSVISEGMGHDSETTTRIYLASLDTSVVDRANELILSQLEK